MPRFLHLNILIILILQNISCAHPSEGLYSYNNTTYHPESLPGDSQQQIYQAQQEYYNVALRLTREAIVERYLAEEAINKKTTVEKLRQQYFPTPATDEKALKEMYKKNKDKIPYSYLLVKGEIKNLLTEQIKAQQTNKLIKQIEREKGAKFLIPKPTPPSTQLKTSGYPVKGPSSAKVTIIEFGDFTCPNCQAAKKPLQSLLKKYGSSTRLIWKYFLLHDKGPSVKLAIKGYCANKQNKFWEFYNLVFNDQMAAMWKSSAKFVKDLKLDKKTFLKCLNDKASEQFVRNSHAEAKNIAISGTPTFFVNGKRVNYSQGIEEALDQAIAEEL